MSCLVRRKDLSCRQVSETVILSVYHTWNRYYSFTDEATIPAGIQHILHSSLPLLMGFDTTRHTTRHFAVDECMCVHRVPTNQPFCLRKFETLPRYCVGRIFVLRKRLDVASWILMTANHTILTSRFVSELLVDELLSTIFSYSLSLSAAFKTNKQTNKQASCRYAQRGGVPVSETGLGGAGQEENPSAPMRVVRCREAFRDDQNAFLAHDDHVY